MKNHENNVVLITGSAGRLGSTFAKNIIASNGKVFLVDIDKEKGEKLVKQLGQEYSKFLAADVTTEAGIRESIETCAEHFGRIDAIVHSAYPRSAGWGTPLENLQPQNLFEDLSKQLGGAILISKHAIKRFSQQGGGHLIHISSIQGISTPKFEHYQGTTMNSPVEYSAIKSGIIALSRWLAKKYRQKNIRVNCISMGGILDKQPESFLRFYKESCNSKGMLDSEDIAGALLYLLSERSQFVTGQNLVIDDGWSL